MSKPTRATVKSYSVGGLRSQLADVVNRVSYTKERVVITKYGRPAVFVVPLEDMVLICALEDKRDVRAMKQAKTKLARGKDEIVSWSKAKKNLGW